uniref:Uncharacterized protein n=1 Tax=Arundo donax TaxID=35708 RepID=A0A0A8XRS4_ARUDO
MGSSFLSLVVLSVEFSLVAQHILDFESLERHPGVREVDLSSFQGQHEFEKSSNLGHPEAFSMTYSQFHKDTEIYHAAGSVLP